MKYKYTTKEAKKFSKHGIDLINYGLNFPALNIVHIHLDEGHYQEFYDTKSTIFYYIIKGKGLFVLNDERISVMMNDIIVIPINTRIYYFGRMDMLRVTSPAFDAKNERHIRLVEKEENPYFKL